MAGGDQQTKQTKSEEGQSSVTVEHGEQLQVESIEEEQCPKKIEVKDKWVKVRVTMDSGAAGHVMPETMFPRVKLERKTTPKKFVAANGEQIKDLGEKTIPFKTNEGIQRCITFRSANVFKPSFQCKRSSEPETLWCWMKIIRTSEIFEMEHGSSWT